jgi:hypothetical protein
MVNPTLAAAIGALYPIAASADHDRAREQARRNMFYLFKYRTPNAGREDLPISNVTATFRHAHGRRDKSIKYMVAAVVIGES